MLSVVSREEAPLDEDEKLRIIQENAENKSKKKQIEAKIL